MTTLVDGIFLVSVALIAYLGWKAGFTRCFFALLAGFLAIAAASKYPNQEGLNFYLIFLIVAVAVFIGGALSFRAVNFIYMTIFDKAAGMILAALVWTIVSVNVVIPALDAKFKFSANSSNLKAPLYREVDIYIRTHIPIFRRASTSDLTTNIEQKFEDVVEKTKQLM
ncbi:MAG: CvpA family protein [Elusimicrobiota bacterium]|jgi:uncharacterized membrane protein required for colicin V production|nr:CvpA family protein [Elusimicrobiota bacterium]